MLLDDVLHLVMTILLQWTSNVGRIQDINSACRGLNCSTDSVVKALALPVQPGFDPRHQYVRWFVDQVGQVDFLLVTVFSAHGKSTETPRSVPARGVFDKLP